LFVGIKEKGVFPPYTPMMNPTNIILLSGGSPLIPDLEETCARASIVISAIIRDPDGTEFALDSSLLRTVEELTVEDFTTPLLCPVFTPGHRQQTYRWLEGVLGPGQGFSSATVIDPTSVIPYSTSFGPGCFVNAGSVLGASSVFGSHCVINRGCSLGHDLEVEDYVSFGPGAAVQGDVRIKRGAMIGINATVLTFLTIGENAVVGAGAVVTRDVPPNTVVVGNPARVLREGVAGFADVGVE
jgi:sugar O-acyltransferase (sialic acid O-acetyltransferase NeuD family)